MKRPTYRQFTVAVSVLLAVGFLVFGTWIQAIVGVAFYWALHGVLYLTVDQPVKRQVRK